MPIPDRKIIDRDSFDAVTAEPRQLAGLYFYQILDCLVDLAYRVSSDFRKRPQLYRDLGSPSFASSLAELNAKYGTEVNFLSGNERNEIYLPIFGSADSASANGSDNFSRLTTDLVRAATAFAEGALERGLPMLRVGVLTAHRPFKDFLVGLHGDSVRFDKDVALAHLTERVCYPVLRNRHVSAVFGIVKLSDVEYPYAADPAEDLLVEQIAGQLRWPTDGSQAALTLTRERISNLQRTALRGAEAIATAIDFDESNSTDTDLELLITKCYGWGTAIASLKGQPAVAQSLSLAMRSATTPQPRQQQ